MIKVYVLWNAKCFIEHSLTTLVPLLENTWEDIRSKRFYRGEIRNSYNSVHNGVFMKSY